MNCESLQLDLPLYLDDVLSDEERSEIEAHLPACPLCRLKLDEYRRLKNDLRMVRNPGIPANVLQKVRNSVASEMGTPTIKIGPPPPDSIWDRFLR